MFALTYNSGTDNRFPQLYMAACWYQECKCSRDSLAKRPIGVLQHALVRQRKSEVWVFLSCKACYHRGRGEQGWADNFSGGDSASRGRRDRRTVVGASKREACYTDKAEAMPFFSAFTALICAGILFPDFPMTRAAEVWDNSGRWGSTWGGEMRKTVQKHRNTEKNKTRWKKQQKTKWMRGAPGERWWSGCGNRQKKWSVVSVSLKRLYLESVWDLKDATKEDLERERERTEQSGCSFRCVSVLKVAVFTTPWKDLIWPTSSLQWCSKLHSSSDVHMFALTRRASLTHNFKTLTCSCVIKVYKYDQLCGSLHICEESMLKHPSI